jgi:hypothetical protein
MMAFYSLRFTVLCWSLQTLVKVSVLKERGARLTEDPKIPEKIGTLGEVSILRCLFSCAALGESYLSYESTIYLPLEESQRSPIYESSGNCRKVRYSISPILVA